MLIAAKENVLKLSYVSDFFVSDLVMDDLDDEIYYSHDDSPRGRSRGEYSDEESESSGSRRSQESESEDDNRDGVEDGAVKPPVLQMCSVHKPGAMLEVCKTCHAALAMMRPEVAKQLLAQPPATESVLSRYAGRSDDRPPSMVFSESTLQLAVKTFTQGRFKGKNHFQNLVQKYLSLPSAQHEALTQDLKLEPMLKKLENEPRFKQIFSLKRDVGDCLKTLRITQRPLFQVISLIDSCLTSTREFGAASGVIFKKESVARDNLKVPKPLSDTLAIESASGMFPLPAVPSLLDGLEDLSERDKATLTESQNRWMEAMYEYRDQVVSLQSEFLSGLVKKLNDTDDYLAFYVDLFGHADDCIRELQRDKIARCFKFEYRNEVLGKNLTRDQRQSAFKSGLLGTDDRVRSVLGEATKQDDLLKKALLPKKKFKSDKKPRSSSSAYSSNPGRSKQPRWRSSDKSARGPRKRSREDSRDRGYERQDKDKEEGEYSPKSKKTSRKKSSIKKKGESLSPSSFSEAWPSFFSTAVIMLVTTVGLVIDKIPKLENLPLGGRISHCIDNWRKICNNKWVLNVVEFGYKIPLKFKPKQRRIPSNPTVSDAAFEVLKSEALDLKAKHAVTEVSHVENEYISSYFAVPNPRSPGKFRPILNLKYFNRNVKKYRFVMEHLRAVRDWIRPGSWCVGLDLKDAYPHIRIHKESQKYLRFNWLGQLLQWICLPFGLTCSPRVLTKILKPVVAFLRSTWHILLTIYMDDMLLQGMSPEQALFHVQLVMLTFLALGWSFNFKKCNLVPSQKVTHLGFEFDTVAMTVSCPKDKIQRLQDKCRNALANKFVTVHDLERLIGTMESVRPATPHAALHYRALQKQLLFSKTGKRIPSKIVHLRSRSLVELKWWISPCGFAGNSSSPITESKPTVDIWTDANLKMGGARSSRGAFFQREWTQEEIAADHHINFLEIRAARDGIAALAVPGDKVRLHLDNFTACSYIRR